MYYRVSPIKFWLLGVLTCGIYPMYVWYKMSENLNGMAAKTGDAPVGNYFVWMLLLSGITCGICPIIWMYKFFKLADNLNAKANAGVSPTGPIIMIIMSMIPIYSFFWVADMNNKLADAYEK